MEDQNQTPEKLQRKYSLSTNSEGKPTPDVHELKRKLKLLKQAIKSEREEFQTYKDQNEQKLLQLSNSKLFDSSNTLQQQPTFDEINSMLKQSGTVDDDMQSLKSAATSNLLLGTQHFLSSGMAKFMRSPSAMVEENGEVYDIFYTQKTIKLLRDKLQKKAFIAEELQKKLEQRESEIQVLRNNQNTQSLIPGSQPEIKEEDNRLEDITQQLHDMEYKNEQLDKALILKVEELENMRNENNNIREFSEKLQAQNKEFKESAAAHDEQVEKLQKEIEQLSLLSNFEQNKEYASGQSYTSVLETNIARFNNQIKELKQEISQLKRQKQGLEGDLKMKELELKRSVHETEKYTDQVQDLEKEIDDLSRSFRCYPLKMIKHELAQPSLRLNTEGDEVQQQNSEHIQLKDREPTNLFMRINAYGEYIMQFESEKGEIVLLKGEHIISIKPFEGDFKHQFQIIYVSAPSKAVQRIMTSQQLQCLEKARVTFQCAGLDQYNELMRKIKNFANQAKMSVRDRRDARERARENDQFGSPKGKTGYMDSIFSFFGSAEKNE